MDFKDLIKTVAPWIGTALGGPLGGLAIDAATSALGLKESTLDALKTSISGATPEDLLAVKKADQDFAVQLQNLGFKKLTDLEAIAAGDRKNARDMQKTTKSYVPAALSALVTLGYFGVLGGVLQGALKINDSQALLMMIGSLTTGWGVVMSFWFGTTNNSERKTELIAQSPPIK